MLSNYFKIAWRYLSRNKVYAFINITGLAIGITVSMLIGLWIWDELSFNAYHKNHKSIAQVMINQSNGGDVYTGSTIAMPVGAALANDYRTDFKGVSLVSRPGDRLVTMDDKKFIRPALWVQEDFPKMFTLNILKGNEALKDPSTLLISESLADMLFPGSDPINQVIRVDNKLEFKIGGVYEDLPQNSTFYGTSIFLPWNNQENDLNKITEWENHNGQLFVQLADNADLESVNEKIRQLPTPHIKRWKEEILLQPMDKLHLYNEFKNGKAVGGRIDFVYLFATIGIFVLLLASINFMNLSTAISEKRAKEVGIRKTMGSLKKQLVTQFLGESVLVCFLAFVFAIAFVQLSLPFFNELADKQIILPWMSPVFWLLITAFTLCLGIISGSYPAFYLSSFKPIKVLKGKPGAGRLAFLPRKILVTFQFTICIILIIGTVVVYKQIEHSKNRPAGYTREGLITIPAYAPELQQHYEAIRTELLQTGAIENMAWSSQSASHFSNNNSLDWPGKDPALVVFFRNVTVSQEFGKTIGWKMKEGRDFSKDFLNDSVGVIINESAATAMAFKNPVGEWVRFENEKYEIVGVVHDMITQSPYDPAEPSVFFMKGYKGVFTLRVKASMPVADALRKIEPVIKKYNPGAPFDFSFVDAQYARKFFNETKIGNLSRLFAVLAIIISCLGLYGLAAFVAAQRTKEIGVRKVLGATVMNIWGLLSRDFVVLVLYAFVIASPVSYYFMHQWLQQYAYHTAIPWWIFAAAASAAVFITLVTISHLAIKSAMTNPVQSLRSE